MQTSESGGGEPAHIEIPSVGISTDFGDVTPMVDGIVDPPTMLLAHRVRGITNPDTLPGISAPNAVYVAAHAWDQQPAAFTALNEVTVASAVELTLQGGTTLQYKIVSVTHIPKAEISGFGPAWEVRPGGLVLLTCSPDGAGSWPDNTVVIAELDQPQL